MEQTSIEIIEKIRGMVNRNKDDIPQGYSQFTQTTIENIEDMLQCLGDLFDAEEKAILEEHKKAYVTNQYENCVRNFAVELERILLRYHGELKCIAQYKELCNKKHIAYAFYSIINAEELDISSIVDAEYIRILYLGLVHFYNDFFGSFSDNEEAIELLCKFYPHELEIEEYKYQISSALYPHISMAGTPQDLGYAYRGINLIRNYIGDLPESVVDELLKKYPLSFVENRIYRHQIFEIITHACYENEHKEVLKFWYLDSVLVTRMVNWELPSKWRKEEQKFEYHDKYYYNTFADDKIIVFSKPYVYWNNRDVGARCLYEGEKPIIKIELNSAKVKILSITNNECEIIDYDYNDWVLDKLYCSETRDKIQRLICNEDVNEDESNMTMTFSLLYLDHYRGMDKQIIDLDHKCFFDLNKMNLTRSNQNDNQVLHIYGKSVHSFSCIVGKNATGKTSIIDFLRETFFKLLKLIEEKKVSCVKGYVKEEEYEEYDILDKNALFLEFNCQRVM